MDGIGCPETPHVYKREPKQRYGLSASVVIEWFQIQYFCKYHHCLVLWKKTNYVPACDVTLLSRAVSCKSRATCLITMVSVCGLVRLVVCGNLHSPLPYPLPPFHWQFHCQR